MSNVGDTAPDAIPDVIIGPPRFWSGLGLAEIWESRELVYFLTKRELQIRYKQSLFGISWVVLQPLVFAFVFALFFGVVVKVPSEGVPYPVFAVVGLVPWLFVSQAITQSAMSLVMDADVLSKVYFPRLVLPIAKALGLMLDLAIAMVVVLVVMLAYGVGIPATAYIALPFLGLAVVTAFGLGTLFAALNVKYRDVAVVVPMLVQVGLFATPVVYPGSLVPASLQPLYAINPMASAINGIRWAVLGTTPPTTRAVAAGVIMAVIFLVVALFYFRRAERFIADVI